VTKKEIVKQIADRLQLTQLKTKDIVQQTFDAIVDTLIEDGRIELRNFGVFEVKRRKGRMARNPRTLEPVNVPPKNVVSFKPGKYMEDRVRNMTNVPDYDEEDELPAEAPAETMPVTPSNVLDDASNGQELPHHAATATKPRRKRKTT